MFIGVADLERHKIRFDQTYAPGEISFDDDIKQVSDLHAAGEAELLRNTLGEIRIRGNLTGAVEIACDRCLEPARIALDSPFDLFYRPAPKETNGTHPERRIEEGEVDLSFYEGPGLELEEALREFVLLSLPMQVFCRPDCKGICPFCGENRNMVECGCTRQKLDERWAALRNIQ